MRTAIACVSIGLTIFVNAVCAQVPNGGRTQPIPGGGPPSAAPSPPLRVIHTRRPSFTIPFSVDSSLGKGVQVHLFVSTDRGANWHRYSQHDPAQGQFMFQARQEGEHWFASRTIGPDGVVRPHGPLQAELKMVIDTIQPQLDFRAAAAAGGHVKAFWRAFDHNLVPDSFKVEYQVAPGQPWLQVPNTAVGGPPQSHSGEASWIPTTNGSVIGVRASIRDEAGNTTIAVRRVELSLSAAGRSAQPSPTASPVHHAEAQQQSAPGHTPRPEPHAPAVPWNVDPTDSRTHSMQHVTGHSAPTPGHPHAPPPSRAHPPAHPPVAARPADVTTNFTTAHMHSAVASSVAEPQPPGDPADTEAPRMTNSRRFRLQYDVDAVGPAGVESVELWGTTDRGQSWARWGVDPDRQSPLDVEVQREGTYGFRIVIVAKNGLSSRTPKAGELADIWVGVDETVPAVRLTSAEYGTGPRAGQLSIHWNANDPGGHLTSRPITILYGETPNGPWRTVAAGLDNTGQHFWAIGPHVPPKFYLRIEVRDEAGNTGVDQMRDFIAVEGLTPRGRIRSLIPGRSDR